MADSVSAVACSSICSLREHGPDVEELECKEAGHVKLLQIS